MGWRRTERRGLDKRRLEDKLLTKDEDQAREGEGIGGRGKLYQDTTVLYSRRLRLRTRGR